MSKFLHVTICSKFCRLRLCQILFELVYSWGSYHKNKKGERCRTGMLQMHADHNRVVSSEISVNFPWKISGNLF